MTEMSVVIVAIPILTSYMIWNYIDLFLLNMIWKQNWTVMQCGGEPKAVTLWNRYRDEGKCKLKPQYSIGGFEWISINLSKSAVFSLQTSEYNLKPP